MAPEQNPRCAVTPRVHEAGGVAADSEVGSVAPCAVEHRALIGDGSERRIRETGFSGGRGTMRARQSWFAGGGGPRFGASRRLEAGESGGDHRTPLPIVERQRNTAPPIGGLRTCGETEATRPTTKHARF